MKRFYLNHDVFTTGFCFELMEGRITLHIFDVWRDLAQYNASSICSAGDSYEVVFFFVYLFSSLLKEVKM